MTESNQGEAHVSQTLDKEDIFLSVSDGSWNSTNKDRGGNGSPMTKDESLDFKFVDVDGKDTIFTTRDGSLDYRGRLADKRRTGGWKAVIFVYAEELLERMVFFGVSYNLISYLTEQKHLSLPYSANMVNNYTGTGYLTPILGGFLADAWFGRFWTVMGSSLIQILGLFILFLSTTLSVFKQTCLSDTSCEPAHGLSLDIAYIGLYVMALGSGGLKGVIPPYGADQFEKEDPREAKSLHHYFNWLLFCLNFGALMALSVLIYLEDHKGWIWGFGVLVGIRLVALTFFIAGTPFYRTKVPGGSPLTIFAQVFVAAFRNRKLQRPSEASGFYEAPEERPYTVAQTKQFRLLDQASIPPPKQTSNIGDGKALSRWQLVPVSTVEDIKMLLRLVPIVSSTFLFSTIEAQFTTVTVSQARTLDRHLGPHFELSAGNVKIFESISFVLAVVFYDKIFVPVARRVTGRPEGITDLQRLGTGLVISGLSMGAAALVETRRLHFVHSHGVYDLKTPIPHNMTMWWLLPQYMILGFAESFTLVAILELFYRESPDSMQALGAGLSSSTLAIGHYFSSILVSAVDRYTNHGPGTGWLQTNLNQSHLNYFYWLLCILSYVNFLFFLLCAKWHKYRVKPLSE